jgi:hypothetical protein
MRSSLGSLVLSGAMSLVLLTGCAASSVSFMAPSSTREASIRASRLCIVNATTSAFPMVREFGPFQNGDHHPDPEGPLKPGATWCTSGYNSYSEDNEPQDATAEILFTTDGSDEVVWGVDNSWYFYPIISWGTRAKAFEKFQDTEHTWEWDLTYPKDSQPNHDYHIRRLDDSENNIEWQITVRR